MSEMAKSLRAKMRDKAKAMSSEKVGKVDSSDWTPAEPINAEVKTGMRPISRRAFKSGGKVSGEACAPRADRKPRKSGGEAKAYANAKINRDVKSANEEREGVKHVGALKSGGRAKKLGGGGLAGILGGLGPAALAGAFDGKDEKKGLKSGGRAKRADGGFSTQKDSNEAMSEADQARAAAASKAAADKAREEGAHGYKKGGRTAKNNGGGFSTQKDSSEDMSAEDQARAAAAAKAAADKAREEGAHGRKAGGRAARKDGGAINFGPAEMPAGKKGASEAQQRATESKQENLSKPSRGRAGHYADGGYLKFKNDPVIPGMKKGGKTQSGRMQRKDGGRTKAKTNINIVIASGKPQAPMGPAAAGLPPGGPGGPSGVPVPVPPPGAGAPPPAMSGMPMMPPAPPMGGGLPPGIPPMARKTGGKVYRSYKDMDAGSGGGKGRLEKSEIEENKRGERRAGGKVYRSYKDMDAGAGSGLGRLEKSEIQKTKH